jgi:hypothetical protein
MAYTSSQVVQAVPTGIQSALVLISKTTVAPTTQQIFTNCFSASYDFYSVKFSAYVPAAQVFMRYGTSGTPDTGSNYSNVMAYHDATTLNSQESRFDQDSHRVTAYFYAGGTGLDIQIQNPFLTQNTYYQAFGMSKDTSIIVGNIFNGVQNTSTSYTDLVLLSASNFSGVVSIYGYTNS